MKNIKNILKKVEFFNTLADKPLSTIIQTCKIIHLAKNTTFIKKNESAKYLYIILKGNVLTYLENDHKVQTNLYNLKKGALIGEDSFLTNRPYNYSATATEKTALIRIKHSILQTVLNSSKDLTLKLSLSLCNKLSALEYNLSASKQFKNKTIAIYNKGDLRNKSWLALELALEIYSNYSKKVLLIDLNSQPHRLSDILQLQKPHDFLIINLPKKISAISGEILKYSTTVINISNTPVNDPKYININISKNNEKKRKWLIGHLARKITNNTVGLALGSGMSGSLAYVGVFKALEKSNINIDMIAGTSGGAVYGAFLAAGMSADKITETIIPNVIKPFLSFLKPSFSLKGLFTPKIIIKNIYKLLKIKDFKDLIIPLKVVATNISFNKKHVFSQGSFLKALQASISIPFLFTCKNINDKNYLDGAIVDPVPVDVLQKEGIDKIIAVFSSTTKKNKKARNLIDIYLLKNNLLNDSFAKICGKQADLFINPDTSNFLPTEYNKVKEIIKIGKKEALKAIKKSSLFDVTKILN